MREPMYRLGWPGRAGDYRRSGALVAALLLAACAPEPTPEPISGPTPEPLRLDPPVAAESGQPQLATALEGGVMLSWLEPATDGFALRWSRLEEQGWSQPVTVAARENMLVSWADVPAVVPITDDVYAAHWLERPADSYASYDIAFALSADGGRSFTAGTRLNIDGVLTEHGFVSWFPWDDNIGVVWLDGRKLAEMLDGEYDPDAPPIGTSLRFARLAADGTVLERGEVDGLVCDCCPTAAAVSSNGPLVVYRDRTPDEIRDIAVVRIVNGTWSEPQPVAADGWHIEGCPVNGPAVDARGDVAAVAWFTVADRRPRVRMAWSADGGVSFGAPIDVEAERAFGQVGIVLLDDGHAAVSTWRRAGGGGTELALRVVGRDGQLGAVVVVAESPLAQPIDVPRLALAGERIIVAWTDDAARRVHTASVPVAALLGE